MMNVPQDVLGSTTRRIMSVTFVDAAETVRRQCSEILSAKRCVLS